MGKIVGKGRRGERRVSGGCVGDERLEEQWSEEESVGEDMVRGDRMACREDADEESIGKLWAA